MILLTHRLIVKKPGPKDQVFQDKKNITDPELAFKRYVNVMKTLIFIISNAISIYQPAWNSFPRIT